VSPETGIALFHLGSGTWSFRPNLVADEGWEYGARLDVTPWWGTDPNLVQFGLDLTVQAGTGATDYGRSSLTARLAVPLPSDLRLGLEAGGGSSVGSPSAQRLWYLGGTSTLRGYDPRAMGGDSYLRGRAELARRFSFGAVSLFSDAGWAGPRSAFDLDQALYSVGTGLSIIDGLVRFDAAWGLNGPRRFRFDAYLDAIL
jgi:hemolysin activation/secretion protein